MSFIQERIFRLFQRSKSVEELAVQIEDLRFTLNSALQDIAVLKSVLTEKGLMDADLYKQLRIRRMVRDHSSAGAFPWRNSTLYPYTLDEKDFLREILGADEAEAKTFEERVADVQTLT